MNLTFRFLTVLLILNGPASAGLIVDQVPASLLGVSLQTNAVPAAAPATPPLTRKRATTGEQWAKFETEFGIVAKDASLVKGTLQTAKYQLDHTTFALRQFVDAVEDALRFDYRLGDAVPATASVKTSRGSSGNIWLDTFNAARFKSDINLQLSGRQFVGVKLVLPLGD